MDATNSHGTIHNTFSTRINSEFTNWSVLHKSTNTIWSTSQLANSEFTLVLNVLLSCVLLIKNTNISQSPTGVAMAKAFQCILEQYGLTQKIHAVNADNATTNDRQTTKLAALNNSFEEANCVWCFNHTLQLSTKALLVPFNTAISQGAA